LVLLIVTFVGWDVRRISASAAIFDVSQSDDPVLTGQQFLEANNRAPERQQVAYRIYETYVDEAWAARENGQLEQARLSMMKAREIWLPLETRNPYELGAQLALAKTSATLVSWGHIEFIDEMRFRYKKIARLNPGIPTLVGTSATALASVGDYESSIRLAEQVIATENQTHAWSKAWYAKGASKFLLGYEEEGIADLLVATEKQPGSQGARGAHSTLARIYRDRGDIESAEFHELMASQ
jgi:tetratricopeptide (TPR) repeat protein